MLGAETLNNMWFLALKCLLSKMRQVYDRNQDRYVDKNSIVGRKVFIRKLSPS